MVNKLVSVIVPVYNVKNYLSRCINSITNQTYSNLEIFLIDDGSTDDSGLICDELKLKDNRIQVFHKKNEGLSEARNFALDRLSGDFILFVDSDDYIEPDMIEKLYATLIKNKTEISMCSFFEDNLASPPQINLENGCIPSASLFKLMASPLGYKYVVVWNKLYKKEIFETFRFPKNKIHEDQWIAHQIILAANNISVISDKLYHHLNRDGSISQKKSIINHFDDIDALLNRADYFSKNQLQYLNQFVEKQLYEVASFYLKNSIGIKNYSKSEIKLIQSKLSEIFNFSKKCFNDFKYTKAEIKSRKKLYKLSVYTKFKLRFLKSIKNIIKGDNNENKK